MSAPGLPRLPWFPRDFRASTMLWPLVARAVYRELLDLAWDVGGLPADPSALREAVRASPEEWARAWVYVEPKFPQGEDGLRRNARLELHRADALGRHASAQAKASRAARARWDADASGNAPSNAPGMLQALPEADSKHCPPAPAPAPYPDPEQEGASPPVPQAGPNGASASPGELDLQATEPAKPDLVLRVFDHWREVHAHPRAVLDAKRRKLIATRLREYSADDLCRCITGYLHSPHHMGQNDRGTVYDDLALLLRDAGHVDAGLRFAERPPVTPQAENASQRIARKVAARAADRQAIEGETVSALESFA